MADQSAADANQAAGEIAPPLVSSASNAVKDKDEVREPRERRPSRVSQPDMKGIPVRHRSSVISGDGVLQLQMRLKANKDERRLTLDARHQFLFAQLTDALGVEPAFVEDQVLGDEKFSSIENFFAINGSRKLMFFYQEKETGFGTSKKLFITSGSVESATGLCLFFLRTNPEKPITPANIAADVIFMWMDCSGGKVLEAFEGMMSKILLPVAKSQQTYGSESADENNKMAEFIEYLTKFTDELSNARRNMTGHISLSSADCCDMLDNLHTLSDYQSASRNMEFVRHTEELIAAWCREIELVITESEQIRREADDVGPSAELQYWINRRNKFDSLCEQVRSPRCKAAVGILNTVKSKSLKKWRQLDACITDSANEAKDNVKFLRTLDNYFGPLDKSNPVLMLDLLPGLINTARMIYSISTYYSTPERMTSLFVKITNQMIKSCKAYLNQGVVKVWDHPHQHLVSRIKDCVKLNTAYQTQFHKTKEKLKEKPEERQFEFSENYIFGKFDTFSKRLEKIADMARQMDAYSGVVDIRVEGIDQIAVRYKKLVETTKKRTYDVLDHRKQEVRCRRSMQKFMWMQTIET